QSSVIDLDLACLLYTSGSTGRSKGVMTDHSNMVFAMQAIAQYLEHTADDRILNVLPLSHTYGLYQLMVSVFTGGCLILEDSFAYPADVLRKIETEQATAFPGVPTVFSKLLDMDLSGIDLSNLRYVTNAGSRMESSRILQLKQQLPQVKF